MIKIFALMSFVLLYSGSILAGTIEVKFPNGADWKAGTVKNITWTASGLTNTVKIVLYKDNTYKGLIVSGQNKNGGTYPWAVGTYVGGTAASGGKYQIKVREEGGASFTTQDMSPEFSITSGAVMIKADLYKTIKDKINPHMISQIAQIKPDLETSLAMSLNKADSERRFESKFFITIKNLGPGNCPSSSVLRILIVKKGLSGYDAYYPETIPALNSGASKTYTESFNFAAPGQYLIKIYADDLDAFQEVLEDNNDIELEFTVN